MSLIAWASALGKGPTSLVYVTWSAQIIWVWSDMNGLHEEVIIKLIFLPWIRPGPFFAKWRDDWTNLDYVASCGTSILHTVVSFVAVGNLYAIQQVPYISYFSNSTLSFQLSPNFDHKLFLCSTHIRIFWVNVAHLRAAEPFSDKKKT